MSVPTKHTARQAVCRIVLSVLMASVGLPSVSQAAPTTRWGVQEDPGTPQEALRLAQELELDLQLVTTMLEAGIPPADISRELAAEWPAHLQRQAARAARRQPRSNAPGVVTPELEIPAVPASEPEIDAVQRLWLAIEAAYSAGDTPRILDLVSQLPPSEWIAAAGLLQDVTPPVDRPLLEPSSPIPEPEEARDAHASAAQRAVFQQAEATSRAAALAPDTDQEKWGTPAGAAPRPGSEATLTVGDSCTYATLQAAVDAAASGDTIRIQGRTYTALAGTVNINGKSLSIYGGYNNTCTVQGTSKTRMDATGTADSVFEIYGGAGPLTVFLDNFELMGGEDDSNDGGGIEIDNQFTVTLNRTTLHDNQSDNGGGVHMSTGTTLNLRNSSLLYLNSALTGHGGGIHCVGGTIDVSGDSYIGFWLVNPLGNTAAGNGGGAYVDDCNMVLDGNSAAAARVIYNAAANGGGIYATNNSYVGVTGSSAAVNDNQILSATGKGGGLYLAGGSDLYVDNGQVNGNTADETGAGVYATDTGTYVDFDTTDTYFCNTPKCAQLSDNINTGNYGGGISLEFGATLDMESVYVEGNQTGYQGSAIYARRSGTHVALDSVMVTGNHTGNDQVLRLFDQATATIQSSTFADNTGHTVATFGVEETTSLDGDGLIVWGNDGGALVTGIGVATLDCSVLQASYPGVNNIVADPQFMDATGGDYHVARLSPAVDHCVGGSSRDIDYDLRPIDVPGVGTGTYDAGADEANAFVGLNGAACAFPTVVSAIAAAASGDTLYISPGVYLERLGTVTNDLSFVAATSDCTAEASGGVTIDANDAAATWGGVAEIGTGRTVTFRNLVLIDGTAQYGGILYVNGSSHVVLDNTDLTLGSASTVGGGLRLILGATVELINGSRILQSTTTGTGDGGGAAIYNATLILRGDSRIGDYLQGNTAAGRGGGVFMDDGILQMFDSSRVRSNVAATDGGGVYASTGAGIELHNSADIGWTTTTSDNDAVNGGGIYLTGSGTTLSLSDDSGVQNNYASNYGGGIYASAGTSVLIDSALVNANEATARGGGLLVDGAAIVTTQNGSTIDNNLSGDLGGGIYLLNDGGTLTIDASHVDNNTANGWFGGIRVFGNGTVTLRNGTTVNGNDALGVSGGGLGVYLGTVNIQDAAIQFNTAAANGGGVYMDNGTVSAIDPDIRYNTATDSGGGIYCYLGALTLQAGNKTSYVAVNTATNGSGGGIYDTSGGTLVLYALGNYRLSINTNQAGANGGAIYAENGTYIDGWGWVQFTSNVAGNSGGALYLVEGARAWLDDTASHGFEIWVNTATNGSGGGICASGSPQVELDGTEVGFASNGNQAPNGDGGGIYLDDSILNADNTLFHYNQAGDDGGAIAASNTSAVTILSSMAPPTGRTSTDLAGRPELANSCDPSLLPANAYCSTFCNNSAGGHGGALHFEGESTGTIDHVALMANTAQTGAALELYDSSVTLRHSRVSGNTATGVNNSTVHVYDVGGVGPTSTFDALHNTFASNTYFAVYYAFGTNGTFDNNIVWGNGHVGSITPYAAAACNDTQGGALPGAGNISQDPNFVATARGAYHLAPGSPALDACATGSSPDLDNVARPKGSGYDMGTFELWCASGIADVNGSGKVDIVDVLRVASDWNDLAYLPQHDIDCDGDVDVNDISAVASGWEP